MKKALFPILIFLLAGILPLVTLAQNTNPWPVKVQTFIAPPYSLRLSDYVESGYDRISVTVSSHDETVLNYRISLKLVIESFDGHIHIETNPSYQSPPIFLTGPAPEMLSAYDVQDLFEISRLNFTGLSKNEYLRTGKLPEGFYRIFFVAIDYNHGMPGRELSDRKVDFAMAGLFLNDPPLLNLPRKQEKVVLYEPRRILFEWTPRHKGSPNSAFDAEYVFRLYEVWGSQTDANIIASTRTPLFETVTSSPRYTYGIEAPELIPGKSYVWTVQAREEQNRDLFRNNGLSEAFIFQYGDECKVPLSLEGEPATGAGIELSWKSSAGHTGYLVRYRTKGTTDGWFEENSLISSARLNNLSYGITFEIQVMAECGSFSSGYSEPLMVAIPEEAPQNFVCGATSNLPPITNKEPLEILLPGSTFTAGGFRCRVKEVSGSNGEFSGTCLVVIPFYGYASVLHTFKNIKINTDYQMYAGKLVAVKDKEKQQEFTRLLDDRPPVYTSGYNTDELAMILGAGNIISLDEPIKKIIATPENGQYIITYQDGTTDTIEVEEGTTAVVEDPKGNQYFIEDGKVKKINPEMAAAAVAASQVTAQSTSDPDSLREALPLVHFVPAEDMVYGFDSLYYEALRSQYETKQVKGENYVVPFKAVATGRTDAIQAGIPSGEYNSEALKFKSAEVTVASSPTGSGNNRKLSVTALSAGDIEPLEAVYAIQDTSGNIIEETLGVLNVVGYDAQSMKLYVVQVNPETSGTYDVTTIKNTINTIYSQAVMQWDVYPHDPLYIDATEINDEQGSFDNTDRDNRMDYTPSMKKVKKAFKKAFPEEKDAVYVFLIKGQCTDNNISGYMPFKGQYAFVFTDQPGGESIQHTIAHEVAHGAFNLRHTFSNECPYYQAEKTSRNLMDYAGSDAITLNKYQWDLIHNPDVILFSWLQDEEEGEIVSENYLSQSLRTIRNIRCALANKKKEINLYFGMYTFTVKAQDLADEFNWLINTNTGKEYIRFHFVGAENIIYNLDYEEDIFDLTRLKKEDNKYQLPGKKYTLFVSCENQFSQEKSAVYSLIKDLFDPTKASQGNYDFNDVNSILAFSECELKNISILKRKELLTKISNYLVINEKEEKIAISLVSSTPESYKLELFNFLKDNPKIVTKLYSGVDENRKELVFEFYKLWYSVSQSAGKYVGSIRIDKEYNLIPALYFDGNGLIKQTITKDIGPGLQTNISFTSEIGTYSPFDIVTVSFKGNFGTQLDGQEINAPVIWIKYLLDNDNIEGLKQAANVIVQAGLLTIGIGEITTSIQALFKGVKVTQNMIRLSLGMASFASLGLSQLCQNDNTEFCKAWREYELLLNLGLLSANLLAELPAITKRLTDNIDNAPITSEQKITVRNLLDESAEVIVNKNFTTLIDDKIKILPQEGLFGNQASTFLNSEYIIAETLQEIPTFRRFGGTAKLRGSYVSTTANLTRDELALVKDFNNSMRFEAVIKIPKGEKLAVGKVGSWPPTSPEFMGGADQIIINRFDFPENVWVESIKDFETGKIYTYGEFRLKFPNLCVK